MIDSTSWRPKHNPWLIALTVSIATFMEVLDTSIANVALPHIAGGLSAGVEESTWVLTSYLIANAVVLPLSGWIADRIGQKRFYMTCVALFTLSSFLCGIAPSLPLLIFFRVLQGMGGGGLAPSEQSILAETFEPKKRSMAFAFYGMVIILAPAIGPTLGGFITDVYSWRWIFFINIFFGIASLILTGKMVEEPPYRKAVRQKAQQAPFDFAGIALVAVGLASLQVVLDKGQIEDWFGSNFIVFFSVIAALCLTAFVMWEWRTEYPVLKLKLLRNRTFAVSCLLNVAMYAVLLGSTVLLPQYLQLMQHYTAERAGMALSAGGFLSLCMLPFVGKLASKVESRLLIVVGFGVTVFAMMQMSNVYLGIDFRHAMYYRMYQNVGLSLLFVPIQTISYIGSSWKDSNQISAMGNLARQLGGSMGISAATTLLARRAQVHQHFLIAHAGTANFQFQSSLSALQNSLHVAGLSSYGASQQAVARVYHSVVTQAQILGYIDAFRVLATVCLIAIPLTFIAQSNNPGQRGAKAN
jgi:MFS transporter, DHA2 family, multidrug resistance protein